ncbi:MAG: ATP synthase F1 subunit gamma [Candidatus Portnoybacteria bacterium]|nr:ATP synthase F1 subunit gamma [Candidatus Portnoybacteria bacterium]
MAKTRDIQRRIKSINSTKKITKAMEMVSAAKMRKAVEAVLKTRAYANLSWGTILNLSLAAASNEEIHPAFQQRKEIKRVGVIVISSNRGLCGGFNSAIVAKVHRSILKHNHGLPHEFILLGKKGVSLYRHFKYNIVAEFPKPDVTEQITQVLPVAKMTMDNFKSGYYDKVLIAFTDFKDAARQIPRMRQILPININDPYDLGEAELASAKKNGENGNNAPAGMEYIFEPSPREVLDQMVPRLIEIQIYQALLESNASEHSARMGAMHQANQAAGDLVNELTLSFNKERQASITSEIAEISAGANALK